jgi:hypothetical protein
MLRVDNRCNTYRGSEKYKSKTSSVLVLKDHMVLLESWIQNVRYIPCVAGFVATYIRISLVAGSSPAQIILSELKQINNPYC